MVIYSCCAINCENNKTNRPDLIFFHFPSYSPERSWEWIVNLGRVDLLSKDMNELWNSYRVCAEHFERHYFTDEQRRKLVYNAVPTIFNHCSLDVDMPLILEALNRIQNEAVAVDGHDEELQAPAQCRQQSLKNTTSFNSQHGKTKSYRCQVCSEVFLTAHQLFSHELRDHEHVGILQTDHTKTKPLPKYKQCEKVFISEIGVHETKMHDRNLWKEASDLKNSHKHDGLQQAEACIMRGTSQQQNESHKTHTSNVGGSSQMQDENLQADTCKVGGKSQKEDGNQQADTCNTGLNSQIQDKNPQTEASDITRNSEKHFGCKSCPEIFISSHSVCQYPIKMREFESEVGAQNMNSEQERDTVEMCNSELEGSTHEIMKHAHGLPDQKTYPLCTEFSFSDSQQFVCDVQDHNKETEFLQQGGDHHESTGTGKEEGNVSEIVNLLEVTSPLSKGICLPYKCHVCEESFGTKCDLFYHDLQVHVGITKPPTVKSWDITFEDAQKNLKEKPTLNKGVMKRKAKNIPDEQQPVKVIIAETQNTDEQEKQKTKNPVAEQVTLKKISGTDCGNKPVQNRIIKNRIIQRDGKLINVQSVIKHEHIRKTIEAIIGKYPLNKTVVERGKGSGLDEHGCQTQPRTFIIVKDGPQSGEINQKRSGRYRIDVVTNYVVSKSQVKQFLMNYEGSKKE